uniref:Uncharacterized protein n=1 Tax=Pseudomonas phage RVTF4 TaxID=3236931 RepID=A0AB39CCQ0_9VIRU
MSLKALIDLANNMLPNQTPEERAQRIEESRKRVAEFDMECAERHRQRIPTQEQLNRVIDYGIRNP